MCILRRYYHGSDFNNKFKLKNKQGPLVVCPDHNLTSKIGDHVLTEEVTMLIAQIKAAKKEQIKEQILKEVMENSKIANNDSEEYENLRMENYLLKDLNAELKDKNMILKELLKKEKELWKKENDSTGIIANKKTYAEIISGKTQKPKRIPQIIIKKKTKREEKIEKINDDITHYLTKEKTIQTNSVYKKTKEETVVVKKVPIKHMTF